MKKWVIILLFIIAILLAMVFTNNDAYLKTDKLYINEVVARNSTVVQDDYVEYSDYIEFFVTYYVEKTGKSYLENERYYYYDKDKVERAIDNNGLELVKIDDGYAKKCLTNKHLFHVRR